MNDTIAWVLQDIVNERIKLKGEIRDINRILQASEEGLCEMVKDFAIWERSCSTRPKYVILRMIVDHASLYPSIAICRDSMKEDLLVDIESARLKYRALIALSKYVKSDEFADKISKVG